MFEKSRSERCLNLPDYLETNGRTSATTPRARIQLFELTQFLVSLLPYLLDLFEGEKFNLLDEARAVNRHEAFVAGIGTNCISRRSRGSRG